MTDEELVAALKERLARGRRGSEFSHPEKLDQNAWQALSWMALEIIRQREEEQWSIEHDDTEHTNGQLAAAASCYAANACLSIAKERTYAPSDPPAAWPWDAQWWKPKNVNRDLIRAGALIAVEWGRWMRAHVKAHSEKSPTP